MKVLWLTNTASLGRKYVRENRVGGGWISSLDSYLQNCSEIDLHIMFLSSAEKGTKRIGKTTYHPIYDKSDRKVAILINRIPFFSKRNKRIIINKINKRIIELNPDVIHIHGTENIFGLATRNISKPVFISIQGNIAVCRHKFFAGFRPIDIIKSVNTKSIILGNTYFHTWKSFKRASQIEKIVLESAANIIGRTDWDRRISLVFNPQRRYFLCNEILRKEFYNYEWNNPYKNGIFKILTINGPALFKGFETICQAIILLENKIDIDWSVAGITEFSPIVKILRKKLRQKYPTSNLKLLGILDATSLRTSLLSTHLYVMPSHIENSPNNLCEAQMLGVPCIATNAGGTSSLITDKITGLLIQDGDPWHLAGAIMEVQKDYDKSVLMAQKGRVQALLRHNPSAIVEKLIKIYTGADNGN